MIPRLLCTLGLLAMLWLALPPASVAARADEQGKGKPKAQLRINPTLVFTPGRIVATVELSEGANDYQDYYCPTIEWEWGDQTRSDSTEDCDPYEAGKSEIRRRYTADKNYREPDVYEVVFRMKQGSKTVLSMRQTVRAQ